MKKKFQNVSIKKLPNSEVEIEAEIIAEELDSARTIALKQIKETVEIPGFRVGHAPENIVASQVGEMKILEKAVGILLDTIYGEIVMENNIRAIGMPKITITKLARGNPVGFKALTAVLPEVVLKNYSDIAKEEMAKEKENISVEDSEVEKVLETLKKETGQTEEKLEKEKIKEEILEHKKAEALEKKKIAIAKKLIAEAKIDIPELLIESELDTMINRLKSDIERAGLTYEGYLSQIKKEDKEIRNEWRENAREKAALQLILNHIAKTENIKPDEEKIKKEMEHILTHHKDADRFRVRMYVENLLSNEAVFDFLLAAS